MFESSSSLLSICAHQPTAFENDHEKRKGYETCAAVAIRHVVRVVGQKRHALGRGTPPVWQSVAPLAILRAVPLLYQIPWSGHTRQSLLKAFYSFGFRQFLVNIVKAHFRVSSFEGSGNGRVDFSTDAFGKAVLVRGLDAPEYPRVAVQRRRQFCRKRS